MQSTAIDSARKWTLKYLCCPCNIMLTFTTLTLYYNLLHPSPLFLHTVAKWYFFAYSHFAYSRQKVVFRLLMKMR